MEIGEGEQLGIDFDWFCVDESGEVGHFTTAGFKRLPQTAASSAEDLKLVTDYFLKEAPVTGSHLVDSELANEIPDGKDRGERYLRSFIAMADKGLFSFDIASYLKPDIAYFRVAIPTSPIHVDSLPKPIRGIVTRTALRGKALRNCSRVTYEETLVL